jgi:hypothetical protein
VDWINGKTSFQVRRLWPIMVQLQELIENLEWFSCRHILWELNSEADALSKDALSYEVNPFFYKNSQKII